MLTQEVLRKNTRLGKTLQGFWRNGSCTHYRYRKIKMKYQGNSIFLGYAQNHTGYIYRILNL